MLLALSVGRERRDIWWLGTDLEQAQQTGTTLCDSGAVTSRPSFPANRHLPPALSPAVLTCAPSFPAQEPELLETLYVTQQMAPEAAELALETALRTLSNALSGNSNSSSSSSAGGRQDSAISTAISGLQEAAHKYGQVRCLGGWRMCAGWRWLLLSRVVLWFKLCVLISSLLHLAVATHRAELPPAFPLRFHHLSPYTHNHSVETCPGSPKPQQKPPSSSRSSSSWSGKPARPCFWA